MVPVIYNPKKLALENIEKFVNRYVSFQDAYSLPIALWIMCTYMFLNFDAFPYMVITAETKRAGKSRLAEVISFCCANPRMFSAMTPATMFRLIDEEAPTVFFDEAEELAGGQAGTMRSVLNMGYRKGSTVPRMDGDVVKEFKVYSPKVFVLIGDVYDTLRDRSIIVRMKRTDAPTRFVHETAKAEGAAIREEVDALVKDNLHELTEKFYSHTGIEFLTDRDEEIWTPIFVMASVMCPERMQELSRIAVDMATEKTQVKKRHVDLAKSEDTAQDDEYAMRLLNDLNTVMNGKALSSQDAVDALRALPTAPWRKFRGDGITMHNIADMLSRFGVRPAPIRVGKKVSKGYKVDVVRAAIKKHQHS